MANDDLGPLYQLQAGDCWTEDPASKARRQEWVATQIAAALAAVIPNDPEVPDDDDHHDN